MSDTHRPLYEATPAAPDEAVVRDLLRSAGARPAVPSEDLVAIREAARGEWRQRYGQKEHASRRPRWALLAAAALAAGIGLLWWLRPPEPPPPVADLTARVERVSGTVTVRHPEVSALAQGRPAALAQSLTAGAEVETGGPEAPGYLALRLGGGHSLRLDAGTRVRLVSATRVELERGAVYLDSGLEPTSTRVAVDTFMGRFQEVGTQFEVRVVGSGQSGIRLRVREGRVSLARDHQTLLAEAGEEMVLRPDGTVVRGRVPSYGAQWDWVQGVAPKLDIEGRTVGTFLTWVARETGWRVEFADPSLTALADTIVLHGSIDHLTPGEAPSVVLSGAGLSLRLGEGTMVVEALGAGPPER